MSESISETSESISETKAELETYDQGTVLLLRGADGAPHNAAFRCPDLEGNVSWALAGKAKPFTSELLARTIVVQRLTYDEMEVAW